MSENLVKFLARFVFWVTVHGLILIILGMFLTALAIGLYTLAFGPNIMAVMITLSMLIPIVFVLLIAWVPFWNRRIRKEYDSLVEALDNQTST